MSTLRYILVNSHGDRLDGWDFETRDQAFAYALDQNDKFGGVDFADLFIVPTFVDDCFKGAKLRSHIP